ncbi:TadA family conjugal transfer-associated ATPase [Gordonia phosphorivorans]|uniref:TadA family conjugal transfer-associated ATPase n=1 Tax=Gordonia phosphorivorans TaxID=1056982 RepID=A0ABV6H430_9ACTN
MTAPSALRHAVLLDRVREQLAARSVEPDAETIAEVVRSESGGLLSDTDLLAALRYLHTELVGAGPLEALLADSAVTDILVTGPDRVWIERGAGLERVPVAFDDEASVRRLAVRLALGAGRRLDDAQPWVDGRLAGIGRHGYAVRLHAMIPPLALDGTCISLRVLRSATMDFATLVANGGIPEPVRDLVTGVVAQRRAFVVVGGTGAGKSTFLNCLLGQVDPRERMVIVEDAPELDPQHPHVVRLVARAPNVEGIGEVSVRTLVRQALRMRPDRIIVGEVRGPEVIDLLTALNTGHEGCAGTLHANSVAEVPARMEALAALGGIGRTALHSQLAAALDVVFGVARRPDGRRGLVEVGAVDVAADGTVVIRSLWSRTDEPGWSSP